MADLIFYTNPQSRGQIIRWMLEEVGAPYETRLLDYATTLKGPEYLAVNPMGKVPAIQHNGQVVTEVAAICAYLADAFPAAGLARRPTSAAIIIAGCSSPPARSSMPSATRPRGSSRPPSASACSAMATST